MGSVVQLIENAGIQVEHIPGGCTSLCQPIDIGINKPLKNRVRHDWEEWMMSQGAGTAVFKPPSRKELSTWIVTSLQSMTEGMVQNSWRHSVYSYFPTADEAAAEAETESEELTEDEEL